MQNQQIEVARSIGVQSLLGLSKGRRLQILCPFHPDRTPSMTIYSNGGYNCWGCGKNGQGALDFLVHMGTPFKDAVIHLTGGTYYG